MKRNVIITHQWIYNFPWEMDFKQWFYWVGFERITAYDKGKPYTSLAFLYVCILGLSSIWQIDDNKDIPDS